MAVADAWSAAGRGLFARRSRARRIEEMHGYDESGYRRLITAEPLLRRAIPALIVVFLLAVALARIMALMDLRDEMQKTASATLVQTAAQMASELKVSQWVEQQDRLAVVRDTREVAAISDSHVLAVVDEHRRILAASADNWVGKEFTRLAQSAEALTLLGEHAGVRSVIVDGGTWLAAARHAGDGKTLVVAMAPKDALLSPWNRELSLNVTLFLLTAGVMLIVLYAYFSQAARAQTADRIFIEANQRVDLALVRGRCGLWDWDMARGRMFWSRSMYDMLGYKPRDGMLSFGDVDAIIHPDDADLFSQADAIVAGETDQIDQVFRMRHADGRWVWMRARAQVVSPGAPELHLIGIAVDVTEQRHLAMRSQAVEERLHTAIERISESFVLWDAQGRLVMCNQKFKLDHGLSDEDVRPGTPRITIEGRRSAYLSERRLANPNGANGAASYERQLADGRWVQVNELKTDDGGVVSIGADITQLKQQQAKLTESERRQMATIHDLSIARKAANEHMQQLEELNRICMRETERAEAASRAKSEFLANMSHELRTPLNAIIGFSEIMSAGHFGPLGNERYVEYATDIKLSGEYLLGVINDILDMSKIEAGQLKLEPEEIDLCPLIRETVRVTSIQAAAKSITVKTDIAESISVYADKRAMKQIIINLLSNAVKFTGEGGEISLKARRTGKALILSIEDNGCGIPKSALRKLGRPFEQVQNQFSKNHTGSGLGLAISRSLAELHGGALKIRSAEGAGTIVSVRIPVKEQTEMAQAA
ncbi:MAG: PAS domain-containing protein [Rhizobiaceae bacterium]|nr:PAS domain-containing protein [Rhizobiaceae bacterium]